jgi:hypothetical protein
MTVICRRSAVSCGLDSKAGTDCGAGAEAAAPASWALCRAIMIPLWLGYTTEIGSRPRTTMPEPRRVLRSEGQKICVSIFVYTSCQFPILGWREAPNIL